jgi:hypothetical protein
MGKIVWVVAALGICGGLAPAQDSSGKRPVVLVVGKDQITASASGAGFAVPVGSAVVGGAGKNEVIGTHSELPEVSRRFLESCPDVQLTLNAEAAHDYTVAVDVQHVGGLISVDLYQLMTLNGKGDPVFVTKKQYLRRIVKPTCAFIARDWKSSHPGRIPGE